MSEEQFESKRERQKARRAARLEQEAQQAKVQGVRRTATYGIVGLVVVALIGLLVFRQIQKGQQEEEQAAEVAARLDELGCTPDERQADLGGGHISGTADALSQEPPSAIYPDAPPSSGRHIGQVAPSGVYDVKIDPRFTTHNLEHGYVVAWYDADAPEDEVAELKAWGEEMLDGDYPKLIVSEYYEDIPDANFAYTAWFFRQTCDTFDADVAEVFTRTHYDTAGEAPEKGIPTHNVGAQGVIDPEGEDLFLPPLDEEFGGTSAVDEVEGTDPASAIDPGNEDTEAAEPAEDEPVEAATE
ncbi:Putative membrane protein [Euzebya pacifica]|uniref:Membrane protein n=1 Tax=Euzebya pacifica TaxID=1608957 RepID=A0A346Y3N6_9ACTN|nr:DUF3105 domain-containing protein [Euzebya pacifica]AXV09083.1 Putative membrane protein [Euzebya pacifica]